MSGRDWRDMIVGDRMAVDREFGDRLQASRFSRQQWGLIMTAVELRVATDGDGPRLVADTSNVPAVIPELDRIGREMGGGGTTVSGSGSGGLLSGLKSVLGLGGGADEEALAAATSLAEEYAAALQTHLEDRGKWEAVCDAAQPSPE